MMDYEKLIMRYMHEGFRITIAYDKSPENPRDYDNLGTMLCWHRRYRLGDVGGIAQYDTPDDFLKWIESTRHIKLPLYFADHSSQHISTTSDVFAVGDSEGRDWCRVGWIYCLREKALSWYGRQHLTKSLRSEVEEALRAEVATFDYYLNGEFYGYVVERPTTGGGWEHVSSAWGYDELDRCEEEAKDMCFLPEDPSSENE
jgi:hypothetical protein